MDQGVILVAVVLLAAEVPAVVGVQQLQLVILVEAGVLVVVVEVV